MTFMPEGRSHDKESHDDIHVYVIRAISNGQMGPDGGDGNDRRRSPWPLAAVAHGPRGRSLNASKGSGCNARIEIPRGGRHS